MTRISELIGHLEFSTLSHHFVNGEINTSNYDLPLLCENMGTLNISMGCFCCINITEVVSRPTKSESLCRVLNHSFVDKHSIKDCKK